MLIQEASTKEDGRKTLKNTYYSWARQCRFPNLDLELDREG